jgi:hypothetical protein
MPSALILSGGVADPVFIDKAGRRGTRPDPFVSATPPSRCFSPARQMTPEEFRRVTKSPTSVM